MHLRNVKGLKQIPNRNNNGTEYEPDKNNYNQAPFGMSQNMYDTGYIPPVDDMYNTGYIPPIEDIHNTGYIPPIEDIHNTGYIPPVDDMYNTGYIPPVDNMFNTGYIPPIDEDYIRIAQIEMENNVCNNQKNEFYDTVKICVDDINERLEEEEKVPLKIRIMSIITLIRMNSFKENHKMFVRFLKKRKGFKKRLRIGITVILFPFILMFLPKITFGFAPSIWLTLSNSDLKLINMYTDYIGKSALLSPVAVEEEETVAVETNKVQGMTNHQIDVACQLISLFENGTPVIQYAYAENIGDGAGYTSGRAGFCTGTGDALEVIKRYTNEVPDNLMAKYINELTAIANKKKSASNVSGLKAIGDYCGDWKKSCEDDKFIKAQDDVFFEWYYEPSRVAADGIGAQYAVTRAELFDTAINHGTSRMKKFVKSTNSNMGGSPADGVDEISWIKEYLNVRATYLKSTRFKSIVYRTDIMGEIIEDGNYNFDEKIVVRHKHFAGTVIE
ncbi:MAG: chitosanase [Lachnospiraceae bacterium]|nr:chitosanase [Lachnospiraceae bacterium]